MQEYLQHIASEGDRWDSLSYLYYGDATAYEQIVTANPHVPMLATLSAGDVVLIPIIDETQTKISSADVPFWLRAGRND